MLFPFYLQHNKLDLIRSTSYQSGLKTSLKKFKKEETKMTFVLFLKIEWRGKTKLKGLLIIYFQPQFLTKFFSKCRRREMLAMLPSNDLSCFFKLCLKTVTTTTTTATYLILIPCG